MGASSSSLNAEGHEDDREPEPGDLIQIFRESYQHWAVYIGAGFVVHLVLSSGPSISASAQAANGGVLKEKLFKVVGKDKWQVNNRLDWKHKPRPAKEIVDEAKAMVDEPLQYDLLSYNCEHFANKLRYGVAESGQVQTAAMEGGVGLLGGLALASVASKAAPSSY